MDAQPHGNEETQLTEQFNSDDCEEETMVTSLAGEGEKKGFVCENKYAGEKGFWVLIYV